MQLQNTPSLHLTMALWLMENWKNNNQRLLLLSFRNSGKSTLVALFCSWLFLQNNNIRILVIAADFELAKTMVKNVRKIIELHPLTKHLKPSIPKHWAADQFTIVRTRELRDPSMLAKGLGANITGLRADVVICDDVEVPNTVSSYNKRNDLRHKLAEIEYVLVPGGMQIYIGTPHAHDSIYATESGDENDENRPVLTGFTRLKIPIFDRNGNSAWPERFSQDNIERIRRQTGPNRFASQMLLNTDKFKCSRLSLKYLQKYSDGLNIQSNNGEIILRIGNNRLLSASCWWDPAYGSPEKGDASVVAVVFTDESGIYWLHSIRYITFDQLRLDKTDEATQLCKKVVEFIGEFFIPSIAIETNGIGKFLPGLLRREVELAGMHCAVLEKSTTCAKHSRITAAFDPILAAGRLYAHNSVWSTPFIREMREWRVGRKGQDDGLDAVAGCLLNEPARFPRCHISPRISQRNRMWRRSAISYNAALEFPL